MSLRVLASEPHVITVKGVYLKDSAGAWVKVIEPDRRVDFSKEEAVVVFFNNLGRVPAGDYTNFRVEFTGNDGIPKRLSAREDFDGAVAVRKGSFIRVAFGLLLENGIRMQQADMTVDADSRRFLPDTLTLEE